MELLFSKRSQPYTQTTTSNFWNPTRIVRLQKCLRSYSKLFTYCSSRVSFKFIWRTAAAAMTGSDHFTNPSSDGSGLTYTFGSIVQIAWETSLERITLTLWSVNATGFDYLRKSLSDFIFVRSIQLLTSISGICQPHKHR